MTPDELDLATPEGRAEFQAMQRGHRLDRKSPAQKQAATIRGDGLPPQPVPSLVDRHLAFWRNVERSIGTMAAQSDHLTGAASFGNALHQLRVGIRMLERVRGEDG